MERINVAELLKDCPKGMELDCTMYDNIIFDSIRDCVYPINVITKDNGKYLCLTKYGCTSENKNAKCVIFPKGKTTWEGFHRPFEDGDILATNDGRYIAIIKKNGGKYHCCCHINSGHFEIDCSGWFDRFATEEEKRKLFDAIKANGYKWNIETKTLEKLPKFKVGDRIRLKNDKNRIETINYIYSDSYGLWSNHLLFFKEQDDWELVPNKFDISALKPFDKVLVRCNSFEKWHIQLFEKYNTELSAIYPFICLCNCKYCQCIPYEGNEHLLSTTEECDNYYKT